MSKTKQWNIDKTPLTDGTRVISCEQTGDTVAHVFEDDATENALLIAAAPELLEALEDLTHGDHVAMGKRAMKLRFDIARETINKAKGL